MHEFELLAQQCPGLYITLLTILGLLVGSFLNVVIYRLPIMLERSWQQEYSDYFGESSADTTPATRFNLMIPRSACPHCGHPISKSVSNSHFGAANPLAKNSHSSSVVMESAAALSVVPLD